MNISESVQALLNSQERIVERFYDRFLTKHPDLRHHFDRRDLVMQASIVTMALVSVEAYYSHRFPATEHYLRVLGHRHFHNGIGPEDFPKFRDVLLETLTEFHQENWHEELHRQWYDAIELAVRVMLEGYQRSYTF
jgi:hemoglobin-like flavoprotein